MRKIKIIVSKIIWKLCGVHWKVGNKVMDILGYDNYIKVMDLQREKL